MNKTLQCLYCRPSLNLASSPQGAMMRKKENSSHFVFSPRPDGTKKESDVDFGKKEKNKKGKSI